MITLYRIIFFLARGSSSDSCLRALVLVVYIALFTVHFDCRVSVFLIYYLVRFKDRTARLLFSRQKNRMLRTSSFQVPHNE